MFKHTAIQIFEDNLTHLFYNDKYAIVFDPAEYTTVIKALSKNLTNHFYLNDEIDNLPNQPERTLLYSFTTHHHPDHSAGNKEIFSICNKILIGKSDNVIRDVFYTHEFVEEIITIPEISMNIECIYTPCHTLDSYCFLITSTVSNNTQHENLNDMSTSYLVTGDTIFHLGVGMFFEGKGYDMVQNIEKLKEKTDDNTVVLYGHDYRTRNIPFAELYWEIDQNIKDKIFLCFGEEMKFNPFFNIKKINLRDLDYDMDKLRELKTLFNN